MVQKTILGWLKAGEVRPEPLHNFSSIGAHMGADTLLVLDIDETLIRPTQFSGSEAWYQEFVLARVQSGMSVDTAIRLGYQVFKDIHFKAKVCAAEKALPTLVREWRFSRTAMVGLTARGVDMDACTHRQLLEIGIHFDPVSLPRSHHLPLRYGVLYSGPLGNKGITLSTYLDTRLAPRTKKIVFVDDRLENLTSVAKHLARRTHIELKLFWYQPHPQAEK